MNVWKLTAANTLARSEESLVPVPGKRRVRVTKVLINNVDALLYKGRRNTRYPIVPGRYAVGLVADEGGSPAFKKNTRVLLHSYLPAADTGTEPRSFLEDDFRVCGRTEDGFLRDFVYVGEDEMTPLPDAVSDDKALLIQYVALANATIDTLDAKQGEHIAVIGASILGFFVSRLLIYRQAAPILVDSRKDRLAFARARGVYYTSLSDDSLMSMVGTVTGGRLADGAVLITGSGETDKELPVKVCAADRHVAYCGDGENLTLDLSGVLRKQLTVHGVTDGTDYIRTAINLILTRAIDLSAFRFVTVSAERVNRLFEELAANPERPVEEINVVNLV